MPRPVRALLLSLFALFLTMLAVRFLGEPWWQRMLGPMFFCAGLLCWIGLTHGASRCRRAWARPWIVLAGAWSLFAVLRWRFPPILPPPQDPFLEKLPVLHLDWHTRLLAWLPLAAHLQALSDFARSFAKEAFARDRPAPALTALVGICLALPGVVRPLPPLDFWVLIPISLLIVVTFALPALAHSGDKL